MQMVKIKTIKDLDDLLTKMRDSLIQKESPVFAELYRLYNYC
jgi:hypothetical protein